MNYNIKSITADDARKLTDKNKDKPVLKELECIYDCIKYEASEGNNSYTYIFPYNIIESNRVGEIIEDLEMNGFNISGNSVPDELHYDIIITW